MVSTLGGLRTGEEVRKRVAERMEVSREKVDVGNLYITFYSLRHKSG